MIGRAVSACFGVLRRAVRAVLVGLIRAYQFLLSPWIGNQCRFYPTCSNYMIEAIERHGAAAGTYLGARRILRCHPWCEGGTDPVPEHAPRWFAHGEPATEELQRTPAVKPEAPREPQ